MNYAPVQNFFGNWVWWLAATLVYNVARRWVRLLAMTEPSRTCCAIAPSSMLRR